MKRVALLLGVCSTACATVEDQTGASRWKVEVYRSSLAAIRAEYSHDPLSFSSASKIRAWPEVARERFLDERLFWDWLRMEDQRDDWESFVQAVKVWEATTPTVSTESLMDGLPRSFVLSPVISTPDHSKAAVLASIGSNALLVLLERRGGRYEAIGAELLYVCVLDANAAELLESFGKDMGASAQP